jgi:hypothetical protein
MGGMLPWFSLRDLLGGVTVLCVIAGLMHGGMNYHDPWGGLCRIGLLLIGFGMVIAGCVAAAMRRR